MYALIDCNNFYASCERVFNPKLRTVPLVILSNNDGCVISRSDEAKQIGVVMGEPAFKLKRFTNKTNLITLSSNFALYGDLSARIMNIIAQEQFSMEIYSIDECFVSLGNISKQEAEKFAENLRKKILKWTDIPVSIGISQSKTLSKIATSVAKKNRSGYFILDIANDNNILKKIKINDIWGIGSKTSNKLKNNFIYSAFDFVSTPDSYIGSKFNINVLKTKKELSGQSCIELQETSISKKSITTSRSFTKGLRNIEDLENAISIFADNCCSKLRKENNVAQFITVYIRTNYYKSNLPQYNEATTLNFSEATDNSLKIIKYSLLGLRQIFKNSFEYKKASVTLSGISPKTTQQRSLFASPDNQSDKLMNTIDNIRQKFGKKTIHFAIQDADKLFSNSKKKLSKAFTTNWNEILEV